MEIGGEIVLCIFFADDLIVISQTTKIGMNLLLRKVQLGCSRLDMSLSISKCSILTLGDPGTKWSLGLNRLEETLSEKYLGIELVIRARNVIANREDRMCAMARSFAFRIMSLSREFGQ